MLGIGTPETLRTWIRRSEVDTGQRPRVSSQMAEENKALRKEIAELRRANVILKAAASFFGAELCATRRQVYREVVRDRLRWAVAAV
jgi:transposase